MVDGSGRERRVSERLPLAAEVMLSVIFPEETFSPNAVRGIATDISSAGIRVKTYQIKKNEYLELLKGVRYAKVDLILPFLESPLNLRGQIVWLDYHDDGVRDRAHCQLGVAFQRLHPDAERGLHYAIQHLSETSRDITHQLNKPRGVKLD